MSNVTLEAYNQRKFCSELRKMHQPYAKMATQGSMGVNGFPDVLVPVPHGRALWFEFKRPGEPLEPRPGPQERRIEELLGRDHTVHIVNDWRKALDLYREYMRK